MHSIPCGALLTPQEAADHANHPLFKHADTLSGKSTNKIKKPLFHLGNDNPFGLQLLAQRRFITQVLVPGFVWGYTIVGWMIYMVSFAVSKGTSIKEGSIVAASGGVGVVVIRIAIPLLHKVMTYKELLYIASVVTAISLSLTTLLEDYVALNFISVMYGLGIGILGCELYISAKVNSKESEHFYAISWLHVAYGTASLLSGFISGNELQDLSKLCLIFINCTTYCDVSFFKPAGHLAVMFNWNYSSNTKLTNNQNCWS